MISNAKKSLYPKGEDYEGVSHLSHQDFTSLPPEARYIHTTISQDGIRVVVTMIPAAARYFHEVNHVMMDNTYKRVKGDFNEWEVTLQLPNQRITASRVYCNRQDHHAFGMMYTYLFETINRLSGKPLRFKKLDPSGTLAAIILDADAAQALGLGQFLITQNNPLETGIPNEPYALVACVVKICRVHYFR